MSLPWDKVPSLHTFYYQSVSPGTVHSCVWKTQNSRLLTVCDPVHFPGKLPWASPASLHRLPRACWRQQKENDKRNSGYTVQFWSPELIASLSHGPTHLCGNWGWFWQRPSNPGGGQEAQGPGFQSSRFGLKNLIHPSWVGIVSFFHVLIFFEIKTQDAAVGGEVCFQEQKEQRHNNLCLLFVWHLYMWTLWLCLFLFLREHWRTTSKSVTVVLTTSLNP